MVGFGMQALVPRVLPRLYNGAGRPASRGFDRLAFLPSFSGLVDFRNLLGDPAAESAAPPVPPFASVGGATIAGCLTRLSCLHRWLLRVLGGTLEGKSLMIV